ncbi:hypothetical protein [Sporolactobacillus laevolacticus]|uniref:Uncharacterized protein n=1 Tax=Sporolactobacillus laevolacticus DSM 442 TaxID=1395513 RepID=V6IZH8_9BACL|nr:hypothetical protein [Sporolactobacillus laevolacticus]EST12221.1 hypothetical protein P343_08025 [Sporolactobacillus laevolacticus DSM 442]
MAEEEEKTYFEAQEIINLVRKLYSQLDSKLEISSWSSSGSNPPYADDIVFYFREKKPIHAAFKDPDTGSGGRVDQPIKPKVITTRDGVTESYVKEELIEYVKIYG